MSPTSAIPSAASLLHAVAQRLAPLFFDATSSSRDVARLTAVKAVESYDPRTPDDYASVGRILALSLAALSAVNRAMEPGVPVELQLGYYGKANSLSQAALHFEAVLANSKAAARQAQAAGAAPLALQEEGAVLAAIDAAMAEFEALQFPVQKTPGRSVRRSGARALPQPALSRPRDKTLC